MERMEKSELERALKVLLPELAKALVQAERDVSRNFRAVDQVVEDRLIPASTAQEVAYASGYAKGIEAAAGVLKLVVSKAPE